MLKNLVLVSLIVCIVTAIFPQQAMAQEDVCQSDGCWFDVTSLSGQYVNVIKATTHGNASNGTSWIEVTLLVNGTVVKVAVESISFKRWYSDSRGFSWNTNVQGVFPIPRGRNKTEVYDSSNLVYEDPDQTFEINKSGWVNEWHANIEHLAVFENQYIPTNADNEVRRIFQKMNGEPLIYSYWFAEEASRLLWDHIQYSDRKLTNEDRDMLAYLLNLPENSFLYWHLYLGLVSGPIDGGGQIFFTNTPVLCERLPKAGDYKRVGVYTYGQMHEKVKFVDLYNIDGTLAVDGIQNKHKAVGFLFTTSKGESGAPATVDQIRWFCP